MSGDNDFVKSDLVSSGQPMVGRCDGGWGVISDLDISSRLEESDMEGAMTASSQGDGWVERT